MSKISFSVLEWRGRTPKTELFGHIPVIANITVSSVVENLIN